MYTFQSINFHVTLIPTGAHKMPPYPTPTNHPNNLTSLRPDPYLDILSYFMDHYIGLQVDKNVPLKVLLKPKFTPSMNVLKISSTSVTLSKTSNLQILSHQAPPRFTTKIWPVYNGLTTKRTKV